ncbi:MAG: hypothetical protein WDM80_18820 [Limisphaerales bacterium]
MSLPKIYDWERVREALKLLAARFPDFFPDWVLIGGGASWFYRESLKQANDLDFPAPVCSPVEEQIWLSKDVDFMGLTVEEAEGLFESPFKPETHTISFEGLEVDFLEEGLRLTLRDALTHAREVRTADLVFSVLAPEILFAEKCALLANKERPQDRLHHAVLVQFLKHEFCADLENPVEIDAEDWTARAREVKTVDAQFFTNDGRFSSRLVRAVMALNPTTHKRIKHWAKHHLPGYTE